ncbi:MAG: formylglycine-generating enzyme family protein [Candidatus Binatia bacterium]
MWLRQLTAAWLLGFVEIPAGPFLMGSNPQQDEQAYENEQPQHAVTLSRYYIAKYPVTVAQFRAFVELSRYRSQGKGGLDGLANHPVVYVSWYDARAHLN